MSYSFRNRPKLSDRYRGKSSDEILNELKNQIDEERKMFFESSPGWESVQSPGSFSRAGQPVDDMMSRGRQDIRSHLDDLAQRHPEFAEHLRCPPWGGEMGTASNGTWDRRRRGSGSSGDDLPAQETMPQGSQLPEEASPSRGRQRQNNLPQYGLRNTVDLGQQQQQQQQQQCEDQEKGRGQRSWSAPPDNRTLNPPEPPRFVSRLDIPINATPNNINPDQGKPPVAPKQPQSHVQNQQPNINGKQSQQGSTVRHIPIFVEGRDEPLLPKASETPTEKIFTERAPTQPTFNYGRPSQFTARQNHQQPPTHMPQQAPFSQNSAFSKAKSFAPQPAPSPQPTSTFQQKQPSGEQQDQSQQKPPPQPTKQSILSDAISRVQVVQKDVDELKLKVDNYSGNSRKDKEYLYLDEMLTRCLVALDNIETEGKEDVRQARKAVIRNIQQCISILESRVPSPDEVRQNSSQEMEKPVEISETTSGPSGQDSVKREENPQTIVGTVRNNERKLSQVGEEQTMEVENLSQRKEVKEETQRGDQDSHPELSMEAEPINFNNKTSDEVKSEPSIKDVISEQNLKMSVTDIPQAAANQLNSDSVKSDGIEYKDGDLKFQRTEKQVDDNIVKDDPSQEQMEIDNTYIQDFKPDSLEKDEKIANVSSKDGTVVSNKTCKSKSPKGSPKKGKLA